MDLVDIANELASGNIALHAGISFSLGSLVGLIKPVEKEFDKEYNNSSKDEFIATPSSLFLSAHLLRDLGETNLGPFALYCLGDRAIYELGFQVVHNIKKKISKTYSYDSILKRVGKRLGKGIAAMTIISSLIFGGLKGCEVLYPHMEPPDQVRIYLGSKYEAEVSTSYEPGSMDFPVENHSLKFEAKDLGSYLVEGWKYNYRNADSLDKKVSFKVNELPFSRTINFDPNVYRIEITYSDGNSMERSTIKNGISALNTNEAKQLIKNSEQKY